MSNEEFFEERGSRFAASDKGHENYEDFIRRDGYDVRPWTMAIELHLNDHDVAEVAEVFNLFEYGFEDALEAGKALGSGKEIPEEFKEASNYDFEGIEYDLETLEYNDREVGLLLVGGQT